MKQFTLFLTVRLKYKLKKNYRYHSAQLNLS